MQRFVTPGWRRMPKHSDAHHIISWIDGGPPTYTISPSSVDATTG
jgi:hypothetical protein